MVLQSYAIMFVVYALFKVPTTAEELKKDANGHDASCTAGEQCEATTASSMLQKGNNIRISAHHELTDLQDKELVEEGGLATSQANKSLAEMTEEEKKESWLTCTVFEVCKCVAGNNEASTQCASGTCAYADVRLKPWSCCNSCSWWCNCAECDDWGGNIVWEDCEWANFGPAGTYPNDGKLMDVPKRNFPLADSDWSGVTSIRVYTDKDDTLECSGGGIAGEDEICSGTSAGELYPGVAEFMFGLAKGPSGDFVPQKVVPISARPSEAKVVLRIKEDSHENHIFKEVGGDDWGFDIQNALYGSIVDLTDWTHETDLTSYDKLGYRKFTGWRGLAPKLGSYGVFVGDNGQGDLVAAQMMLKYSQDRSATDGALRGAFIHDVKRACPDNEDGRVCRSKWAEYGIFFFENYAHAAELAKTNGFMSQMSCQLVCNTVKKEVPEQVHCSC